jgi:hypothetical protein
MHIFAPNVPVFAAIGSFVGVLIASFIAFITARQSSAKAFNGITHQIAFQTRVKKAEFRQAWINELRTQMSTFQSIGVTPHLPHIYNPDFYKAGTMIELLMNPGDPHFKELQRLLYRFLGAVSLEDKYKCNPEYISLCQTILKTEWERLTHELDVPKEESE